MKSCKSKLKLLARWQMEFVPFSLKIINFMELGKRNSILGHNKRFRRKKRDFSGTILSSLDVEKSWTFFKKNNWFFSLGIELDRFRSINRTQHTRPPGNQKYHDLLNGLFAGQASIKWKSLFSFAFLMLPKYWCFLCVKRKKRPNERSAGCKEKTWIVKIFINIMPSVCGEGGEGWKKGRKTEKW